MEGDDEGVAGGVGIVSLGRFEVDVVAVTEELREEGPGLSVVGDEELGFGVDEFPVGSMALPPTHCVYLKSPE